MHCRSFASFYLDPSIYVGVYRILILASAVFYYGSGSNPSSNPASLFDAYDLVKEKIGQGELFLSPIVF